MGSYHGIRSFNAFTHEKAVLEKSPALDESVLFRPLLAARYVFILCFHWSCRCRTHAAVRFPPYTPFKTFLIKIFSLHAVSDFVNVPVPMFRMLCKAAIAYGIATALGVSVSFTETPVTEYIKSFFF